MRTNLLIHLIDASAIDAQDPLGALNTINRELALFDPELAKKPQIVVANKIDLPEAREKAALLAKKLPKKFGPLQRISAATTDGTHALVLLAGRRLAAIKQEHEAMRDAAGT
jgi:GTP-binding protein